MPSCSLAGGGNSKRCIENARKAYDLAAHHILRLRLNHSELNTITASLERLKFELARLQFPKSEGPAGCPTLGL